MATPAQHQSHYTKNGSLKISRGQLQFRYLVHVAPQIFIRAKMVDSSKQFPCLLYRFRLLCNVISLTGQLLGPVLALVERSYPDFHYSNLSGFHPSRYLVASSMSSSAFSGFVAFNASILHRSVSSSPKISSKDFQANLSDLLMARDPSV